MQGLKKTFPTLAAVLAACLAMSAPAFAQNTIESVCRWQSVFPDHLGIDPGAELADGQTVQMVKALVADPDRLHSMGLFGVHKGDHVNMVCIGADVWRIKHYATGLAITFSTRPL